jgi:type IV secretory pathway TraG/TraD family ATPase VirD4
VADCDAIAEGFIASDMKGENSHFTDSARQLYSGGIMHLMTSTSPAFPDSKKTLAYLYDRISRPSKAICSKRVVHLEDVNMVGETIQ